MTPSFQSASIPVSAQRRSTHPATLIILSALWMATVGNLALWRALDRLPEMQGVPAILFGLGFAVAIGGLLCALMAPFIWRTTLKPVLTVLLVATAFAAHFMLVYGVVIDPTMMVNVFQTDARETADLLTLRMVITIALLTVPPLFFVWRRPQRRLPVLRQIGTLAALLVGGLALALATAAVGFKPLSSTMRNHTQLRYLVNPLNSIYAVARIAFPRHGGGPQLPPLPIDGQPGSTYAQQARPPLLLLMLGETGRAGNFGINGYARPTTPGLSARTDVLSRTDAWSCGTSTAASVPCMFSPLGRDAYESRDRDIGNMLDAFKAAGLAVLWVDNQGGCKGVCDNVPHASTTADKDPALCDNDAEGGCLDGILLEGLDERIAALAPQRREKGVVVVLHTMGSHGPAYYKRSPPADKRFLPECETSNLPSCDHEAIVNAYDNSILYTDHVLASSIRWLEQREQRYDGAMIYVADHGESLGENNIYLHGMPYAIAPDVQKHVAWIEWISPQMLARKGMTEACLKAGAGQHITHDSYFSEALGLMDIGSSGYKEALDPFAACSRREANGAAPTPAPKAPSSSANPSGVLK